MSDVKKAAENEVAQCRDRDPSRLDAYKSYFLAGAAWQRERDIEVARDAHIKELKTQATLNMKVKTKWEGWIEKLQAEKANLSERVSQLETWMDIRGKELENLDTLLSEAEVALQIAYNKTKGLSWKGGASGPSWITEPRRILDKLKYRTKFIQQDWKEVACQNIQDALSLAQEENLSCDCSGGNMFSMHARGCAALNKVSTTVQETDKWCSCHVVGGSNYQLTCPHGNTFGTATERDMHDRASQQHQHIWQEYGIGTDWIRACSCGAREVLQWVKKS